MTQRFNFSKMPSYLPQPENLCVCTLYLRTQSLISKFKPEHRLCKGEGLVQIDNIIKSEYEIYKSCPQIDTPCSWIMMGEKVKSCKVNNTTTSVSA